MIHLAESGEGHGQGRLRAAPGLMGGPIQSARVTVNQAESSSTTDSRTGEDNLK